ncbi:MAG: DUF3127 domain-containing protein, partial [Solirubrobacteraceae bacterium]
TFSSGFRKKELVVVTQEQYPQQILIEFVQDKVDLLSGLNDGDDVTVSINVKGREWVNAEGVSKYFNSIQGWRVEKSTQSLNGTNQESSENNSKEVDLNTDENEIDDLPF